MISSMVWLRFDNTFSDEKCCFAKICPFLASLILRLLSSIIFLIELKICSSLFGSIKIKFSLCVNTSGIVPTLWL